MRKSLIITIIAGVVSVLTIASCSKDVYDEETHEQLIHYYSSVDSVDQQHMWLLSQTKSLRYQVPSGSSYTQLRIYSADPLTSSSAELMNQISKDTGIDIFSRSDDKEAKEYFDDLRDMWLSTLTNMEDDAKSWSLEITRIMVEDLINSLVLNEDFNEWLTDWKNRYKEVMSIDDEAERERRLSGQLCLQLHPQINLINQLLPALIDWLIIMIDNVVLNDMMLDKSTMLIERDG